MSPHCF
ncbi:hypothetical protein VTH06DRAFT_883 [Thermothelomyces fergusii]